MLRVNLAKAKNLQSDNALQALVKRSIHNTHPAFTDFCLNPVPREQRSYGDLGRPEIGGGGGSGL
jgi:hypothetical protein